MNAQSIRRLLWLALCLLAPLPACAAEFALGADVSWVDEQEASGLKFYSAAGMATDPFVLLRQRGINAIRLRVWVNPADGWNDAAHVLAKARRAAAQGQRILIDFHYSDTWADPGHQTKPAAWANHTPAQLKADVYAHTENVLRLLKKQGIAVDWVQVGNEINAGMLWPEGSYTHFDTLAGFINSGYRASKAVYPDAPVIVHVADGVNNDLSRWFFDGLRKAGARWDIIGLSHYPEPATWPRDNARIIANMADLLTRYDTPVMVCEVGMDWQQAQPARAMLADLIKETRRLGPKALGVFYWEPQAYPGWQGYTKGALDQSGKLTPAMDAFGESGKGL